VYSSEWLSKPAHTDGHHHIVYDYSVGGAYYSGEFLQCGFETDDFLKPGETFEVRYAINNLLNRITLNFAQVERLL
jgi:hypothetical protein